MRLSRHATNLNKLKQWTKYLLSKAAYVIYIFNKSAYKEWYEWIIKIPCFVLRLTNTQQWSLRMRSPDFRSRLETEKHFKVIIHVCSEICQKRSQNSGHHTYPFSRTLLKSILSLIKTQYNLSPITKEF